MKKRLIFLFASALLCLVSCTGTSKNEKAISFEELRSKIAGAWLGQMVGNIYGLEYENKFVEQPGEGPFVWNKAMRKMTAVDGAFSDDDTDVEYMYLLMMEKYGVHTNKCVRVGCTTSETGCGLPIGRPLELCITDSLLRLRELKRIILIGFR